MFKLALLVASLICVANSRRFYRRRCRFRNAGLSAFITDSSTNFVITNTFAEVTQSLTLEPPEKIRCRWVFTWWRYWRSHGKPWRFYWRRKWCRRVPRFGSKVVFWLPSNAVVSQLDLTLFDEEDVATTYRGQVFTNEEARNKFRNRTSTTKSLLIRRWTNEQFTSVALRVKMDRGSVAKVTIGWKYLIPLNLNSYRLYFPVNMPKGRDDSTVSITGTIIEQAPLNVTEVESPQPGLGDGPTITSDSPYQKNISWSAHFGDYKDHLLERVFTYYPWWKNPRKWLRGRRNYRRVQRQYQYDLVFSLVFNHTLPNNVYQDRPSTYRPHFWSETSPCVLVGFNVQELIRQNIIHSGPPTIPIYSSERRTTFFVDDYASLSTDYWAKVKTALITTIRTGATPGIIPPTDFFGALGLPDSRVFTSFRIVVLASDGTVQKFPSTGLFEPVDGALTVLDTAATFINGLPDALESHAAKWSFKQTQNELVKTLKEYVDWAISAGEAGKNETVDVIYFSNMKPENERGNFLKQTRRKFVQAVQVEQNRLMDFTKKFYAQSIFAFGFGPNSDYNLLDALTTANNGRVRMAFEFGDENIVDLARTFYRQLGRVIAGNISIGNTTITWTNQIDAQRIVDVVPNSIVEAGYALPVMRDYTEEYFTFNLSRNFTFLGGNPQRLFKVTNFKTQYTIVPAAGSEPVDPTIFNGGFSYDVTNVFQQTTNEVFQLEVLRQKQRLCKQGAVVRILQAEQAQRMIANGLGARVRSTPAELEAIITREGLNFGLQTNFTALFVENVDDMLVESDSDGGQAVQGSGSSSGVEKLSVVCVFFIVLCTVLQ